MNLIELHIIQSFPVTCLNRDDVGAPKSARFGGVQRARVSSQCWKRAIRLLARQHAPGLFAGQRSRYVIAELRKRFAAKGAEEEKAQLLARAVAVALGGTIDNPALDNVKTMFFFSPQELDAVVESVPLAGIDVEALAKLLAPSMEDDQKQRESKAKAKKKPDKASKKEIDRLLGNPARKLAAIAKDAADIAIFGRMVADDHSLTVEGAGLFSHALSTHAVTGELDFFSAVDDLKPDDTDAGAGHIGTIEFNSACYYRYVGVNLDMLADEDHLGHFMPAERAEVLRAFLRAALLAVPPARKNSMFGFNPPAFVLGLRRAGQPLSLVNAFETPVRGTDGYLDESRKRLLGHWDALRDTYGLTADVRVELPSASLGTLVARLAEEAE
jgi:CRISPR system Cascade subunit CasC